MFVEYAKRELGVDLCFQGFETELAELPAKYGPPRGVLLVVLDDGAPIACGALHPLEESICELKRIYIRPTHRGRGLGRTITLDLMDRSRALGYTIVRLDTLARLKPANQLYRSLGFTETEPYNFNPEDDIVYLKDRSRRGLCAHSGDRRGRYSGSFGSCDRFGVYGFFEGAEAG